jgi:cysteine-rich repeat protein
MIRAARSLVMAAFLVTFLTPRIALSKQGDLGPRGTFDWRLHATLERDLWSGLVTIKIEDHLTPEIGGDRIVSSNGAVILDPGEVFAPGSVVRVEQGFELDLEWLRELGDRARARCSCELAELANYFTLEVRRDLVDLKVVMEELNAAAGVEIAYPVPDYRQIPPPEDIPPTTPDFSDGQGYRGPAPDGIDIAYANTLPGGRGEGLSVVDIEYGFDPLHEDLEACRDALLSGIGTFSTMHASSRSHGSAVLGILVAGDNGYGITGMVPEASCHFAYWETDEYGMDAARAILASVYQLPAGTSVMMLEMQVPGPNYVSGSSSQYGLIPVEWEPAVFDAVRTAVADGWVIVEAAGNGQEDLDDTSLFGDAFDRTAHDSGAIVVGAGEPPSERLPRGPEWFTNWGSRLDVQGWGSEVTTLGYGYLFWASGDHHQWYTDAFGGTSSATPIVASAAAAVMGVHLALVGEAIEPSELRDVLVETGTPQADHVKHIGPLPDLSQAIGHAAPVCGDRILHALEVCDDGNTLGGDGCSADCLSDETCGNGYVDAALGEVCDDGGTLDGDGCSADCLSDESCGNSILDTAAGEVCDDWGTLGGDGCRADCLSDESCGNSILDTAAGEVCDDGGTLGGDGCSADCLSDESCGNSILDTAVGEVCDDGGILDGDGCSADCLSDESCGNGTLDEAVGERCDDGNVLGGDGCSPECRIETKGCGCEVVGHGAGVPFLLLVLLVLGAGARGRRARRCPPTRSTRSG